MFTNYICALDIGSSKISAVAARLKGGHLVDLFFESMPSKGIKRGAIVDSVALIGAVSNVLKNLRNKSGINIKFIYANISGRDVVGKHSHAVIPLAERGNKVIVESDMEKVSEQARLLASSLEDEIIHQIPSSYTIDSASNVLNPIGLYSHRLEVDLYLICVKLSSVQNLARVINQAGYEIKNLFFSGAVTSRAVFAEENKERVSILADIGGDITELLFFENGLLRNVEILPIGGNDITLKLSEELKVPLELAEDVKRSYASVGEVSEGIQDKEILLKKDNNYKPISQKLVSELVTVKAKDMCQDIAEAVKRNADYHEISNFVACGRTTLLDGFLETLENKLGLSVRLGRIVNPEIISLIKNDATLSSSKYLTYLTSLGIISEALRQVRLDSIATKTIRNNLFVDTIGKLKEIYHEYF